MNKQKSNDIKESSPKMAQFDEGYITLPMRKGDFQDFIKSLLGSPQSINKNIRGPFEITFDDLKDIYNLIIQRITQQNDGTLAKFLAKLVFSDDSSVELNTIQELLTYKETRPIISIALHLSWDFIVKFQDKEVPEKQKIQLSFISSGNYVPDFDKNIFIVSSGRGVLESGIINFRIEHTARTWGTDIESLLSNHIQHILKPISKIKQFIRKYHGFISFISAIIFFINSVRHDY